MYIKCLGIGKSFLLILKDKMKILMPLLVVALEGNNTKNNNMRIFSR